MTNSSGYDGLTSDVAAGLKSTSAYKPIAKYAQEFDPFYESLPIGEGTGGKVFSARIREGYLVNIPKVKVRLPHCNTRPLTGPKDTVIAYKKIRKACNNDETLDEVKVLLARKHDHILPVYDAFTQRVTEREELLYIVTPLAVTDMDKWFASKGIPTDQPRLDDPIWRRSFLLESITSIVEAVAYCHAEIEGVWCGHYDIKPKNILLFQQSGGRWLWKLADFGLSAIKGVCDTGICNDIGTDKYQPPEYYENPKSYLYGPSFDVFSTGCVVLQLATLIAFQWRSEVMDNTKTKGFAFRNPGVAEAWSDHVKSRTEDKQVHHLLDTALQMMSKETPDRLLAFDAALDLKEITSPQMDISIYERYCEKLVRGQSLNHKFSPCYKPIQRALSSARKDNWTFRYTRARHLSKMGWANMPMNVRYSEGSAFTNMPPALVTEPFYGRDDELGKIESLFALNRTVCLYGIGGVGKSHLAWKYVKDTQERKAREGTILHTFWIQARNSYTITQSYASIAEAIGGNLVKSDGSFSEKAVLRWLNGKYEREPWILILDGVTTSYEWKDRCAFGAGPILVTTKDQDLGSRLGLTLSVKPLKSSDNIDLFFTMISRPLAEDYDYAGSLVKKLQLPLLIKIMARTIDSVARVGSSVRSIEEALKGRPALAAKLKALDVSDPHSDDLLPSVENIFDMLFETFKKESRVYGCNDRKCLAPDTGISCHNCKRTLNHSIEVLRLMCFFSRNQVESRLIEAEATDEKCKRITEEAFVVLTNFCYITRSSSFHQQYDIHDLVYTMFPAWYDKDLTRKHASERQWKGRLRALGMVGHDYKQERRRINRDHKSIGVIPPAKEVNAEEHSDVEVLHQKPVSTAAVVPLSLLKTRYRNHIVEFVQYIRDGKPAKGQFHSRAADSILTFARIFNEENRFDVSQLLLRFLVDRGIKDDTKREKEIHARIDLVSSLDQSTRGRFIGKKLEELLATINDIKETVEALGGLDRYLRLCIIQKVWLLLRLRRIPEAERTLQEIPSDESVVTREGQKSRLTVLTLRAQCLQESGMSQSNFEKLHQACNLWEQVVKAISDSPYDAVDRSERLEGAEKNLAGAYLLLIEKAPCRKTSPSDFDAEVLCTYVFNFYEQLCRTKESKYSDQGRENTNHVDIIDAENEFAIANLRIGIWEADTDKVEDAVQKLHDLRAKYEAMGLDFKHQSIRNSVYRCQEGLAFLTHRGVPQCKQDLHLLTSKYGLMEFESLQPHGRLHQQNPAAAWKIQAQPECFLNLLDSTFGTNRRL